MSHRRAKKIRQHLLPSPRAETGVSRGTVVRSLTEYDVERHVSQMVETLSLILKPDCPRAVLQRAKRYAK